MIKKEYVEQYRQRATEMVSRMTLTEKVSQLRHHSKALPKHNIPEYNWWNECLHGVARAGVATVFPQAIAMASTFEPEILHKVGDIISTEARAKHHDAVAKGERGMYQGLTFWSPNINIFRDPRWGRGQETYGEDPFLTSVMGTNFIRGLQGDDDKYLKVSACAKHYAVHSGPEAERHTFNSEVNQKDLHETYLRAFESAVKDGGVESVMTAYNRVNGEACAASPTLLQETLRGKWGFDGHVVSDCGGVGDVIFNHKITLNPLKGVALALKAGLDLECGIFYSMLGMAVKFGYLTEEDIDQALIRILVTRFKLGMFDEDCPYASIPMSVVACPEHEKYAIEVAEKGIVLLENKNNILPLRPDCGKVGLFGYNATNDIAYLGNYYGTPSSFVNAYDGLKNVLGDKLSFSTAIPLCGSINTAKEKKTYAEAIAMANDQDYLIVCTGIDSTLEGEAGDAGARKEGIIGKQGDRSSIDLPQVQINFIDDLSKLGKPIIVLNFSGSCINFKSVTPKVDAILQCWYPGAKGGEAIANILFGKTCPSGRLPVTFYAKDEDLADFYDYSMKDRTYRYFHGKPAYPFGYGLSYADITYDNVSMDAVDFSDRDSIKVSFDITNHSDITADQVSLLFVRYPETMANQPIAQLIHTDRTTLAPNGTASVEMTLTKEDFFTYNDQGEREQVSGEYTITLGFDSPIVVGKVKI